MAIQLVIPVSYVKFVLRSDIYAKSWAIYGSSGSNLVFVSYVRVRYGIPDPRTGPEFRTHGPVQHGLETKAEPWLDPKLPRPTPNNPKIPNLLCIF